MRKVRLRAFGLSTVGLDSPAGPDGFSQVLQNINGHLPADTGIGDTDTLLQARGTLSGHLLVTLVDVGLEHDTDNGIFTLTELVGQFLSDKGLVAVVLVGVTVRAVDHDHLPLLLPTQGLTGSLDVGPVVVGALGTTTQDDKAVLVTRGLGDGGQTLLSDTQETVGVGSSTNGINGNRQVSIRTVLVTDGETQTRGKLTVQLRLGSTGSDGTEGDEVGQVLRGDCVQHLTGNGHAGASKIGVELTGDTQTLVDVVGFVKVRVIDQTLPSDSRTGLLEVGTHEDAEITGELPSNLLEATSVLDCGGRVMDRARTNDDK